MYSTLIFESKTMWQIIDFIRGLTKIISSIIPAICIAQILLSTMAISGAGTFLDRGGGRNGNAKKKGSLSHLDRVFWEISVLQKKFFFAEIGPRFCPRKVFSKKKVFAKFRLHFLAQKIVLRGAQVAQEGSTYFQGVRAPPSPLLPAPTIAIMGIVRLVPTSDKYISINLSSTTKDFTS